LSWPEVPAVVGDNTNNPLTDLLVVGDKTNNGRKIAFRSNQTRSNLRTD
jgi:hypothetical protein